MKSRKKTKKLGQVFLKNKKILRDLASSLGDINNEIVVEIGGEHGELSQFLTNAKKLIIYEIDKKLAEILKNKFPQAIIKNENFLNADLSIFENDFLLIGNIPYSITGKIIKKIFTLEEHPKLAVLTLQKEYGEKLLGSDGNNFLYSWIKIWCEPQKLFIIKKKNFFPTPKVDSIAIKFTFLKKPLVEDFKNFEFFLKNLFKYPNRNILNNLKDLKFIEKINEKILYKKPHQLSFEEILEIFLSYNS